MDTETPKPRLRASAARKTQRRAPGRPGADAPDLRASLLDAALACYARKGIAATSLRDIAVAANVTPALLHYYFGDRAQLQDAVVAERVLPVLAPMRERLLRESNDVADLVAGFVNAVAEVVQQHPWWPQLWVREVLCDGGALRDLLLTRVAPDLAKAMAARFAQARDAGRLNADLDPRLLLPTLVGLVLLPAAGAPIWRQLFNADDLDMDDVRRHALALLDRGLELGS